jgi:hypothetical protein
MVTNLIWAHNLSSKLGEMDRSSLLIEVEEGLGRRSAVAEAILCAEQETEIVMFTTSCLILAKNLCESTVVIVRAFLKCDRVIDLGWSTVDLVRL